MPGAAHNMVHPHVPSTWADWYAVVSSANLAVEDINKVWIPNVDAIGVRAIIWGSYYQILHGDVVASIDRNVDTLTVERFQAVNQYIVASLKREWLQLQ